MRYLAILILLSSCSADFHLKRAIKKGANLETKTTIEYDTIEVPTTKDSLIYQKVADTSKLKSLCDSLLNQPKKAETAKKIQELVCPEIIDTMTLEIPLTVNDSLYKIKVKVLIEAIGGSLKANLQNEPSKITYVKSTVSKTEITAPPQKIKWWHVLIVGLACLVFGRAMR